MADGQGSAHPHYLLHDLLPEQGDFWSSISFLLWDELIAKIKKTCTTLANSAGSEISTFT